MFSKVAATSCLLMLIASTVPAFAEQTFEDNFANLKTDWSGDKGTYSVADDMMHLKTKGPDSETRVLLSNVPVTDADISVSVTFPTTARKPDEDGATDGFRSGIIFWASDLDNHYQFKIGGNKHVLISRVNKGRWTHLVDKEPYPEMKTGKGEWDDLRVTTKGNQLTCYLNGKQLCQMDGQPPDGTTKVGLYASDTQDNDYAFRSFSLKY